MRTYALAIALGLLIGFVELPWLMTGAEVVSSIFMNLLSLVSLPIIFLSITTVATRSRGQELLFLGRRTVIYTLLTTILASCVALALFVLVDPVQHNLLSDGAAIAANGEGYLTYLIRAVPSNVLHPFLDGNVLGVLLLALLVCVAAWMVDDEHRTTIHKALAAHYALFMAMVRLILRGLPLALCAFVALFIRDVQDGKGAQSVFWYLSCVVGANLIQALVVIPLLLYWKGISPWRLAKAMAPALSVAFFTKSSSATVPTAIEAAVERAKISPHVAKTTLPLCTSINMNGCAAFILTTVLFVSMSYGVHYSWGEMLLWIAIATIAAVGNASVPMGCFFLSSAFLAAMGVPLQMMGIILPFYALIDAIETAINVWSDSAVTAIVDSEVRAIEKEPAIALS